MFEKKIIKIANYFIKKSEEESVNDPSRKLTALKLQKLLYYAKAWGLVLKNKEIFKEEFQAWIHGPANPAVWHHFKTFDFSVNHPEITTEDFSNLTEEETDVLDTVWKTYGKFDGKYLEALTHAEDPWLIARQGTDFESASKKVITNQSMKDYYERRLEEASRTK